MFHSISIWLSNTNNLDNAVLILLSVVFGGLIISLGFIEEDEVITPNLSNTNEKE